MHLKHFLMLIILALVSPFGLDSDAHAQSVVRLGEARIALTSGRATINLSGGSPVDRFQLESIDHAVQVISAKMTFADGRVTSLGSLTLERANRSGELVVGTPGVPVRVELVFRRQSGARTRIVVFGHVVAAQPAAPATSDAPGVARKAYRASKGARPVEAPQTNEAGAAREREAAEQSERLRQEAARRQAEERSRQEQVRRIEVPPPVPAAKPDLSPTIPNSTSRPTTATPAPDASGAGSSQSRQPADSPVAPYVVAADTGDICKQRSICTPVPVFFGTDRKQVPDPERINFGADRNRRLQLGQAIVTVPRVKRQAGKVLRPTLFETLVLRIPEQGDPARHFTIPKNGVTLMTEDQFLAAVRVHRQNAGTFKDHAFVFVHGYNMEFDSALYRTAQIAFDLSDVAGGEADRVPFGTAFLYTWPSGGGTFDYVYDHESARGAEGHFREFLDLVIAKSGAKQVHLIAHSLGNAVLLNVLQDYKMPTLTGASINQVILAAPAIDAEEFGIVAGKIKGLATGGITLYASSNDQALYAASGLNRGRPMAGDVPTGGPVIVAGIESIDVSAIPTDSFWGHDRYADRRELLEDIWRLVSKGVRPPDSRSPRYKVEGTAGRVFWRYVQ
jgi:esterase/lipase superfamily enzyme